MSEFGSLYIKLGEPEGELCGCTCEVGDWAAKHIADLVGAALDWAVAKCLGIRVYIGRYEHTMTGRGVAETREELKCT